MNTIRYLIGTFSRFFIKVCRFEHAVLNTISAIADRIEPNPRPASHNARFERSTPRNFSSLFGSRSNALIDSIGNSGRRVSDLYNSLSEAYNTARASIDREAKQKIADIENSLEKKRHAAQNDYRRKTALLEKKKENADDKEERKFQKTLNDHEKSHQGQIKRLKNNFAKKRTALVKRFKEMRVTHPRECRPWNDDYWNHYTPLEDMASPPLTRFGEFEMEVDGAKKPLLIPAFLSIISVQNVIVNVCDPIRNIALKILRVIMLRLLVSIPPAKLKFELIDPLGLGLNMAGFMHLPESMVGTKIWTEPEQIERRLIGISEHQEKIYQKYLRNDFSSMEDYNHHAGEIAEPYRVLVVLDFPANFTETAVQRLVTIANNGPRTGVYLLLMRDMEGKLPQNFDMTAIEKTSVVISAEGDKIVWQDVDFKDFELFNDKWPPWKKTKRILRIVGDKAISASQIKVPFSFVAKRNKRWWKSDSKDGIRVPIGRSSANNIVYLELGKGTNQGVLIGAITGAGKSNLLHVFITSLYIHYSPDEINLYLIDFKKGVEFREYSGVEVPHVRVIAIESDREFAVSVLQGLAQEMDRRGDLFRKTGVQNIGQFRRKHPDHILPRIVLIVDEFQDFFAEDDWLSGEAASIIDQLARKGRAFGIHIILASQSMAGTQTLSRSTLDQLGTRIALKCTDMESRLILGEDNPQAKLLSRPGEAYLNNQNGLIEGNVLFQVFLLPDRERRQYLGELGRLENNRETSRKPKKIVFEGNAPSHIRTNEILNDIIHAPVLPDGLESGLTAWLGEPIAIKPPTATIFHRESRSNLMIIGKNKAASTAMMACAVISLGAQRSAKGIEFLFFDFTRSGSDRHDAIRSLLNHFPRPMALYDRATVDSGIDKAFKCVNKREKRMSETGDPAIFLIFMGIQRASKLRTEDGYTFPETTEKLFHILNHGPEAGVFTLCWGDTLKNAEMVIGRKLHEFGFRVALQMPLNESNEFIDSSIAAKLGKFKAILYEEDRPGQLEKFRPYAMPDQEWLKQTGGAL